ncbi:MAG: hypothetical protein AAB275_01100 [Deltaproteobacteria bacterium]
MNPKVREVVTTVAVTAVIMVAMIWGRTYYSQWKQFNIGEEAFKAGNMRDAVTGYESALHMYTPGSGMVKKSIERLWEIGEIFERQNQSDWALLSYRSLRSSLYAVRSFYTPYPEWIERCDKRIAQILAFKEGPATLNPPNPPR